MWSTDDIAKLDERIRETKRLLEAMQRQRSNMMRDRMAFKKMLYRARKRKEMERKNELQVS